MKIVWETPPPAATGKVRGKYREFFDELRANPGVWAKFPNNGKSRQAQNLQRGQYKGTEPGEFEAVSRKVDSKMGTWVRAVPVDGDA